MRGDREALGEVYDAHAASLFRHALALARNQPDAEDLVQAVFLKLATTGAPLLAVRRPADYLHRILKSAWIDAHRRGASRAEEHLAEDVDPPASGSSNASDAAIDVNSALAQLPAEQREVVTLHLLDGFSFREAGRITGVSMFTAASRYRLALGRLRQVLGKTDGT